MIREAVFLAGASFAIYLGMTCRSVLIIVTQWMDFTFQGLGQTNTCSKMPWEKERERERERKKKLSVPWYCHGTAFSLPKSWKHSSILGLIYIRFVYIPKSSSILWVWREFRTPKKQTILWKFGTAPPQKNIMTEWPGPKSDAVLETNHGLSSWQISISFEWSAENSSTALTAMRDQLFRWPKFRTAFQASKKHMETSQIQITFLLSCWCYHLSNGDTNGAGRTCSLPKLKNAVHLICDIPFGPSPITPPQNKKTCVATNILWEVSLWSFAGFVLLHHL